MKADAPARHARSREVLGNAFALLILVAAGLALLPLHDDPWWQGSPGRLRWSGAVATTTCFVAFCGWIAWRGRARRERAVTTTGAHVLVAWASQTGFAREVAERTADALARAGMSVQVFDLARVDAAMFAANKRVLFVASTTGEGDPPDHALAFVRDVLDRDIALPGLRYAVLALGDREYSHYCGFGRRLDQRLRRAGASPLFDRIEVDNGEAGALRHWQHHLGLLSGATELADWTPAAYERWTLQERYVVNPGSAGADAVHLELHAPPDTVLRWQAGDIAEIGPRNATADVDALLAALVLDGRAQVSHNGVLGSLRELLSRSHLPPASEVSGRDAQRLADLLAPLPHREYSIASLPQDGSLHLLVRRMQRADGRPGLGSSWLCEHAPIGGDIALRIRANPNFHTPGAERPMILIGNGTGIAGLRAHLKARLAAGASRNWLLFGERNAAYDRFYGDEIEGWHRSGHLQRLDLAYSRDRPPSSANDDASTVPPRHYVQHALRDAADDLRAWVAQGAAIYVCGSLQGMAPGVDAVLREMLGDAHVEDMLARGDYRRDVY